MSTPRKAQPRPFDRIVAIAPAHPGWVAKYKDEDSGSPDGYFRAPVAAWVITEDSRGNTFVAGIDPKNSQLAAVGFVWAFATSERHRLATLQWRPDQARRRFPIAASTSRPQAVSRLAEGHPKGTGLDTDEDGGTLLVMGTTHPEVVTGGLSGRRRRRSRSDPLRGREAALKLGPTGPEPACGGSIGVLGCLRPP